MLMNKFSLSIALVGMCSCSPVDDKREKALGVATGREMEVVLTLSKAFRTENKAYGKYINQKINNLPTWLCMMPLDILHTASGSQKRPVHDYDKFSISLKELTSYTAGRQPFALQDSVYLFKQVYKEDRLLDSTAFKPESLLTPHEYNQSQVKRKIRNRFYRFSQPLFSPDSSSAYIQVDQAGSRTSYIMSNSGGKWLVVKEMPIWVE